MTHRMHHVLVVDDDEILRAGICDLLDLAGYHVTAAFDGVNALELLEGMPQPPAIIVSDIRMPHMDGYQLLQSVRERPEWISIPFIFLSAKGEKEDIRQGKLRGADDYVSKPFDFQDLLVAIQSSLSRHQELYEIQEERLESLKQRILNTVNHEFRTPLSYIVAYADLMANSPTFQHSEELRQYIAGINEGSGRLMRLVEKFLTLAELESGFGERIYQNRRQMIENLAEVVDEVVASARPFAELRGMQINVKADGGLPAISGDPTYLRIALTELVDNAIKFTPREALAPVDVEIVPGKHVISIYVNDKGLGIKPEDQEDLFAMFHQIDRQKREIGGTGSGLTIVQHVARLHGGQIRLESQPGAGCRFELRLPLPDDEEQSAA